MSDIHVLPDVKY